VGFQVRVLTANLWNGGADPVGFAELVAGAEVDVACVQELAPEQAEALARVLPEGRLEPARDHTGMGIALRRAAPLSRIDLPRRDARIAVLSAPGWPGLVQPLEVIAVHVSGPHVWPYWRSWRERRAQLRGLETYLRSAPHPFRLLVGDLNATPLWPVYRRLTRHLGDVHADAARRQGARPARTWGPTPGAPRLLRIDHALGRGLRCEAARVVRVPGGDHSALIVDVAPRSPEEPKTTPIPEPGPPMRS